MFCMGMSIFGVFFLSLLAILIGNNYPYAGEWYESKPAESGGHVEPLDEQRHTVVHNLWVAVGVYGAFAVVSGLVVCTHRLRGRI